MDYYAFLDENNIVTQVIAGKDQNELIDDLTPEEWYANFTGQRCVRTSINGNIRKQYAGVGYTYDETDDVFITPQPYQTWVLDENHDWQAPVPYPDDGESYVWDEDIEDWVLAI